MQMAVAKKIDEMEVIEYNFWNALERGLIHLAEAFCISPFLPGTWPSWLDFEQPPCDHKAMLKLEAHAEDG